jgi:PHD/YefM family antitoxin component YafN of YafNO toxin-antitoxin module
LAKTAYLRFLEILNEIEEEYATVAMTRNGEPVGMMMTPGRYEALLDTIEILSDNKGSRALKAIRKDFNAGRV